MTTNDYERGISISKERAGASLAEDVKKVLGGMRYSGGWDATAASETAELAYRDIGRLEFSGRVYGAQRLRSDEFYESFLDDFSRKITGRKTKKAELQVLGLGEVFFAGVPAEYFVEFQLGIKEKCFPLRALTVGGANGMIGYVPTMEAFARGGYETTPGPPSFMAPGTGEIISEKITDIVRRLSGDA